MVFFHNTIAFFTALNWGKWFLFPLYCERVKLYMILFNENNIQLCKVEEEISKQTGVPTIQIR